jgi:nucleoside-diphosphate-sugar epimerase
VFGNHPLAELGQPLSPATFLITGATGFVGGHVAEGSKTRGHAVHVIARPGSDTALLERQGAVIHRGDLTDAGLVREAVAGADVVVHCAAKVGDWGPASDYRTVNVEALRTLLEACADRPLRRFVHLSSLGVYAFRHHHGTDESEPLPAFHMDGYTQTKVEAERLIQDYRHLRTPLVVLRPGFVYGPRDRTVLPRLIEALKAQKLPYLGGGKRALNTIYVGNLVEAVFLAVEKPEAVGQVYNLTDGEFVSKKQFIDAIADGLGLPRPKNSLPLWLARLLAGFLEWEARRKGATKAPKLTQARVKFLGMNLDFSIAKARRELDYRPRFTFTQGMNETIAWYKQNL